MDAYELIGLIDEFIGKETQFGGKATLKRRASSRFEIKGEKQCH